MNAHTSPPPQPFESPKNTSEDYGHYCKPGLVERLRALRLDVTYDRAEGDYLSYQSGGRVKKVLDLVGGYGANLLGHNHPDLVAVARQQLDSQVPFLAQASCRAGAAALARALCDRLGDYVVTFVNSGTEAVEAAIKHAHLERPRPVFWAVKGGFHGKTLGSVQFTWSQRDLYSGLGPRVRYLDPDDPADWASAAAESSDVSAAIFEPLAGEGGVKPRPAAFLRWLAETCRAAGIPLIADEVQTGMGRTGSFLASAGLGLDPDYICLGKALGGGLAKVGAMLVRRDRYVPEFATLQSSTFAEDEAGCRIGLEALKVVDRDHLLSRCTDRGAFLVRALEAVRSRYPGQIKEVRGSGLMVGLELQDQSDSHSYAARAASQQGILGYLVASVLLHDHDIRIMPTLSQPLTLRVQPSAYISELEIVRFATAIETVCKVLKNADSARLLGLPGQPRSITRPLPSSPSFRNEPPRTPRRVSFLVHLLGERQLSRIDPALAHVPEAELTGFLDRTAKLWEPVVMDEIHLRSPVGETVHLTTIGLGLTARQMIEAMRGREAEWVLAKLETGVGIALGRESRVVGFGGFTSIVSHNCKKIRTPGAVLTTGNSLTVGMGLQALLQAAQEKGIDPRRERLAVIGATGNIASTYAQMIAPLVREVVLIVRDRGAARLNSVVEAVTRAAPDTRCTVADDFSPLPDCPLIVSASNSPDPLIFPRHLGKGPVVVCDISLPPDVSDEVARERPDVRVVQGGIVRLPLDPGFSVSGIGLPPGHSLACMAETVLMGLEGATENWSVGAVTPDSVRRAMAAAEKHGFRLADASVLASGDVGRFLGELRGRQPRVETLDLLPGLTGTKPSPRMGAVVTAGT